MPMLPPKTDLAVPAAKRQRRQAPNFGSVIRACERLHDLLSPMDSEDEPYLGDLPFAVAAEEDAATARRLVTDPRVPACLDAARFLLNTPAPTVATLQRADQRMQEALDLLGLPLVESELHRLITHSAGQDELVKDGLALLVEDGLLDAVRDLEDAVKRTASRCY